jgi:hypothetical protein
VVEVPGSTLVVPVVSPVSVMPTVEVEVHEAEESDDEVISPEVEVEVEVEAVVVGSIEVTVPVGPASLVEPVALVVCGSPSVVCADGSGQAASNVQSAKQ